MGHEIFWLAILRSMFFYDRSALKWSQKRVREQPFFCGFRVGSTVLVGNINYKMRAVY